MIKRIFKSKITQFILVEAVSIGLGMWVWSYFHPSTHTIVQGPSTTVTIEKPVLSTVEVEKIITDPAQQSLIRQLFKANSDLKLDIIDLHSTIASLNSSGGTDHGGIIVIPEPDGPKPIGFRFKYTDFQMEATFASLPEPKFDYQLNQKFSVVSTTGRAKDGSKIGTVRLYQQTPAGNIEIPSTSTSIYADERTNRWLVSPRIQGGVGLSQSADMFGAVGFQWLKRGKSTAAEDTSFAILSPTFTFGPSYEVGILPISWNIGTVRHQPFTNLWLSPSISTDKRVGIVLSATF